MSSQPPRLKSKILIIDDDRAVRDAMSRLLSARYDVVLAESPQAALLRFDRGERFDAIVCDIFMPEMTGPELYERMEREHPEQAARFLFVSGSREDPSLAAFFERVAAPRLWKPCTGAELVLRIEQVSGRAAAAQRPKSPSG